ncbi:nucleotidyltransferase family protein [Pseudomonas sp. BF-R-19]|uniref:nucleotidyltransferase family protein n=1 Tax=Pseudomonas sp. BF-R-19 TaxID=2832397 RepID=UPI002958C633|nr:nucleotidyltransferase family protein [Pseudomonas sp. BF-R-19]
MLTDSCGWYRFPFRLYALTTTDCLGSWSNGMQLIGQVECEGSCEVAAPLGHDDLFELIIRQAGMFATEKSTIYQDPFKSKNWMRRWPVLTFASATLPRIPSIKAT